MASYTLYVKNIPFSSTEEDVADIFSNYGQVTNVRIITNRGTNRSKGYGFVTFASKDEMEAILQSEEPIVLADRTLLIEASDPPAAPRNEGTNPARYQSRNPAYSSFQTRNPASSSFQSRNPASSSFQSRNPASSSNYSRDYRKSLYITGIERPVRGSDIRSYFQEQYQRKVVRVYIPRIHETNYSRNYGFVYLETVEETEGLEGDHVILGVTLKVEKAREPRARRRQVMEPQQAVEEEQEKIPEVQTPVEESPEEKPEQEASEVEKPEEEKPEGKEEEKPSE